MRAFMTGVAHTTGERRPITGIESIAAEPGLVDTLHQVGLSNYRHARDSPIDMAAVCIAETLDQSRMPASGIDILMLASSTIGFGQIENTELLRLSERFGLTHATPIGVSAAECANFGTALHLARTLVTTGEARNVLLVTADACTTPEQRLLRLVNSVVSDGAASCLITTQHARIEILTTSTGTNHLIRAATNPDAIAALTRRTLIGLVDNALSRANIDRAQIHQVITNNINTEALRFITLSAGLDHNLTYLDNVADFAHVHSADNLINLQSYLEDGAAPDQIVLTVSHAFGTWGLAPLLIR
ncbi:hypothetical protein [Nocardia cerradoensis]|uniref:Beta-ketoacyl-[acyl-carrier-protein] synthase III N-terminal domain-containing protein n=1 Tax=Nocardia cerradoensis TaxID=85688 RepID=A0A231GV52_9NOCA|nr:hypothetical protein [Nocardia cerradoensis]NKY43613.1 hypothetical protein [Nocardia cerradoensis]OXR40458.1 hypothetical protein B7C42_07516 [Nocardia cerradoensis]